MFTGLIEGTGTVRAIASQADGAVLELDSTLTDCVNQAIAQVWEDGSQQGRIDEWIDTGQSVPFLQ